MNTEFKAFAIICMIVASFIALLWAAGLFDGLFPLNEAQDRIPASHLRVKRGVSE